MGKFNIEGLIKTADELKTKLTNAGLTEKAKEANTIFEEFNTNKIGQSENALDIDEQVVMVRKLNISDSDLGSDGKLTVDGEEFTYTFDSDGKVKSRKTNMKTTDNTDDDKIQTYMDRNRDKVHLTDTWKDKRTIAGKITSNTDGYKDIQNLRTADQVLDKILELENISESDIKGGKAKLKELLIKFNPSMFKSDGTVHLDADWSKLDFPDKDAIKNGSALDETTPADESDEEIPTTPTPDKNDGEYQAEIENIAAIIKDFSGNWTPDNTYAKKLKEYLTKTDSPVNKNNIIEILKTFNFLKENLFDVLDKTGRENAVEIFKKVATLLTERARDCGVNKNSKNYAQLMNFLAKKDQPINYEKYINDENAWGGSWDNELADKLEPYITGLSNEIEEAEKKKSDS